MKGKWIAPLSECGIGGVIRELESNGLSGAPMLQPMMAEAMLQRASNFPAGRRALLIEVLKDQTGPDPTDFQSELLLRLAQPNSVTVVAGHQLVTGLGPLYVHAKVAEIVALAAYWTEQGVPTVPVFWMASEDHDADEIRRLFWRGKVQGSWAAPTLPMRSGVMPAEPVAQIFQQWLESGSMPEPVRWAAERSEGAYRNSSNLADATRTLLRLWHPEVLVLDASDPRLKAAASELWEDEVLNQTLYRTKEDASAPWGKNAPPVPFRRSAIFALDRNGSRFRMDRSGDGQWTRADGFVMGRDRDVAEWAKSNPDQVSPNALLRPIYQEWILPNAAYTGGAGELAYAYQLVPYLAKTKSPHGVWRLRHSGSWIPQKVQKAREAFGESRFRGPWQPELLRREVLSGAGAPDSVHLPVTKQFEELVNAHYNMPGLERSASAWVQRVAREEARMLERVRREFAHREAVKLRRLDVAAEALMPSGILQERVWTHFDLVEHGGLSAVGAYFKAYAEDSKWDEPGWWEFR